jgi:hypothetical protein
VSSERLQCSSDAAIPLEVSVKNGIHIVTFSDLSRSLFSILRDMDDEATSEYKGWPTGLRWYCHHESTVHPERIKKREDIENSWVRRIGEFLRERHRVQVRLMPPYPPPSRQKSDLLIHLDGHECAWIEVKGAWTYEYDWYENEGISRLLWYSAEKSMFGRQDKCIESDIQKLKRLSYPQASHIGALLLGFDLRNPDKFAIADSSIEELRRRAGLRPPDWTEDYQAWDDPRHCANKYCAGKGHRTRCWFWHRSLIPNAE